ncbi:glycosyl hydrolase 53 family protein [Demequina sp. SYSU T00192]|uniref:Arabinogalactan endo-beta-1,4-galactanase n=1 Tax=Demequina litoralis TaxID=3051660 RepID=A0ABT8GBF1_9MICO|nr:glycosyl hydrolase 53 family protein [Demequina sp. SYSU T00192]MDN4476458.1 glycosyl hydrolase 53 family protein [Demequina sp. SYSU T00192]
MSIPTSLRRAAAGLSAATLGLGVLVLAAQPVAAADEVAVPNASFEDWTNADSWIAAGWSMTNTVWVSSAAARTGEYSQALGQWNDSTTLSQTVTAAEGSYDVSIFVWANESLGDSALVANGKSEQIASGGATQIDGSLTWDEIVVTDVPVAADGLLEIQIVIPELTSATLAGYLDDVTVVPASSDAGGDESGESFLAEPGFEEGGAAWDIGGDLVETGRGDSVHSVRHAGSAAQETSQTVTGLEDGYYRLTAWVQNDGAYDEAYMFASGGGDSDAMTAIPRTNFPYDPADSWKKTTLRGVHVTSGTLEVGLRTSGTGEGSVVIDDLALLKDEGPYEMLIGGDISALTYTEDSGGRYFDSDGVERDPLEILADSGWNIVRIRVYNDPGKGRGSDGYYVPEGYVDAADALDLSRRAKAAGLQIQLSFHYSDYWTNPGIQMIPSAWQTLIEGASDADAVTILEGQVHDYTKDLLDQLAAQGTSPEYVAIGNETRSGMLFPYGTTGNWDNLARFYNSGAEAVREAAPEAKVIIHLDDGGNTATYRTYFTNAEARGVDYDIIGTSFYPYWTGKSAPQFADFATTITQQFGKPMVIMETGFNYQADNGAGEVGQLMDNGPYGDADSSTPELQRDFMIELFSEMQGVPHGMVIGDLYWDPIQLYAGGQTGWAYNEATDRAETNAIDNTTLFDLEGHALPVLDAYRLNTRGSQVGTVGGRVVDAIGQPVAGATVTLGDRAVVTNAYGDYYLPGVEPGDHSVSAGKSGLGASSVQAVSVTAGARTSAGLELTGGQALRTVSGTVKSTGGDVLPGALLRLTADGFSDVRLAGADGTYAFPAVPAGRYQLTVVQDGYVSESLAIRVARKPVVQAIALIPDVGSVAGQVFGPGDEPIEGATVSADGHEVTTGADGSFVITGVPSGSGVTVSAEADGYLSTVSEPLVVEHSQTTSGVRIVLPVEVAVANGGFEAAGAGGEATAEGWTFTSDPEGAAIRQDRSYFGGAYEGQFSGVFWLDSDYAAAMEQELHAETPGVYTVRAAVYSGVNGRLMMQLKDEAGAVLAETVVPTSSTSRISEVTATVTSPTFTVAFVVDGLSGDWAVIDGVVAGYLGDGSTGPESCVKPGRPLPDQARAYGVRECRAGGGSN